MSSMPHDLAVRRPAEIVPAERAPVVSRDARIVLRVFALLCAAGAVFMAWSAATGYRI